MKGESRKSIVTNQRKNTLPTSRTGSMSNPQVRSASSKSAYQTRDVYKYHLKVGNRIVYAGITNDLKRREMEHKQTWPNAHIEKVGRKTTGDGALKWERQRSHKAGQRRTWHVKRATKLAIDLHREAIKELERH